MKDKGKHVCIFVSFNIFFKCSQNFIRWLMSLSFFFSKKDNPYYKKRPHDKHQGQGLYWRSCPFVWMVNSSRKRRMPPHLILSVVILKSVSLESPWLDSSPSPSPDLPALDHRQSDMLQAYIFVLSASLFDRKMLQVLSCHSSYDSPWQSPTCQSLPQPVTFIRLDSWKVTETSNWKCLFASAIMRTVSGAVKIWGHANPPPPPTH